MPSLAFLCLKIFICRIVDVSLGTVRTIVNVKGKPKVAALIGFIEATIWFLVVREALLFDVTGFSIYFIAFSYAAGFASGTFIGGMLAKKLITTDIEVQVVTTSQNNEMLESIRDAGYAITVLDINTSRFGKKKYMLFAEIKDNQLKDFKSLIYSYDKKAFVMVHETKYVYNGFFKKK